LTVVLVAAAGVGNAAIINVAAGDTAGLIAAINTANGNGQTDVINLGGGSYDLTASDNTSPDGANGLPVITTDITINGTGATIRRTGAPTFRILEVGTAGALTLNAVTVSGGSAVGGANAGGGIVLTGNTNSLTLTDSTVTGNSAGTFGGGIALRGSFHTVTLTRTSVSGNTARAGGGIQAQGTNLTLTLDHSRVTGNQVVSTSGGTVDGGGISISGGPITIALTDSVVDGNTASSTGGPGDAQGGGISSSAEATYTILRSTLSNNHAVASSGVAAGGGFVDNGGAMVGIVDSTISGNTAAGSVALLGGGGIESDSSPAMFDLNNVTVTNNQARIGGGIDVSAGIVVLRNTILAGNTASAGSPDCFGSMTSHGHNLFGSTAGCTIASGAGDVTNPSPLLGPLADNGGATMTHALLPGSPAVDTGDPAMPGSGGTACEATDQRGITRPQGSACDIGAFEASASTTTTTLSASTTTTLPGCGAPAPTFQSIDCRLDILIAQVQMATDLANLKNTLLKSLTQARTRKLAAEGFVATKKKLAKKRLKEAIRKMITFNFRVRSRTARRKIPDLTRKSLMNQGTPIQKDMQSLLRTL
jgi:hypothetical protein